MADELPVHDILCEAMEYLVKLGSNLRTRSESLREKRIRKGKLKNTHAVQKAANKVLLICQLSKKSLENVESGVHRILSAIRASQSGPVGGNSTKQPAPSSSMSKTKYQYLEIGKQRIRIPKNIKIKHYQSAKVDVGRMSTRMLEMYPVYHECKLLRLRKKLDKESKSANESIDDSNKLHSETHTLESCKEKHLEKHKDSPRKRKEYRKSSDHSDKFKDGEGLKSKPQSLSLKKYRKISIISSDSESDGKKEKITHAEICDKDNDSKSDVDDKSLTKKSSGKEISIKESDSRKNQIDRNNSTTSEGDDKCKSSQPFKKKKAVIEDSSDSNTGFRNNSNCCSEDEQENAVKEVLNSSKKSLGRDQIHSRSGRSKDRDVHSPISATTKQNDYNKSKDQALEMEKASESMKEDSLKSNSPEVDEQLKRSHSSKKKKKSIKDSSDSDSKHEKDNIECTKEETDKNKKEEGESEKVKQSCEKDKSIDQHSRSPNSKEKEIHSENTLNADDKTITSKRKEKSESKQNNSSKSKRSVSDSSEDCEIVTIGTDDESNDCGRSSPVEGIFKGFVVSEKTSIIHDNSEPRSGCVSNSQSPVNKTDDESQDSSKRKTTIKCVSLSKLLKPTVLKNIVEKMVDGSNKKKSNKNDCLNRKKLDQQKKADEEYWQVKRKEVSCFKPKSFSINVSQLSMSTKYMKKHNIKRIISNGAIIKKIDEENADKPDILISKLDSVKCSLLNDSESDINESDKDTVKINKFNKKNIETEKHDTVVEKPESKVDKPERKLNSSVENSCTEIPEKNKNILSENRSREHSPEPSKSCEAKYIQQDIDLTPRKAKSALLNDSSPDNTPKTPEQNKSESDGRTPQSARKKIMESMHAKKMLLTYSSSDTEDEELNKALKEIKKSLLKGNSSDEDISKEQKKEECKSNKTKRTSSGIEQSDSSSKGSEKKKMGRTKTKPTCSSNQNSDTQDVSDKEIEGLTNLKTIIKTRRRRDSADSQDSNKKTKERNNKMPTAPTLEKDALESYKSSNSSEIDDDVEEDLPTVSLSGLNGDGLGHQAKDDLLDESDSSSTQNDKEKSSDDLQDTKKEAESEEDNVKLKRRKANAISSDSEVGSSRKKGDMSDFEDSDGSTETSKKNKKSKRKKSSDSDGSDGDSSSEGGKKKRRRIKQVDSGGSGSDTENEGRKHGRKNIRKVMGKDQLEEATKKAARQEKERVARIFERQKLYNNLQFDESGKPDEVVLEKVILDFDPETKEPLIQVDRGLVKKLKPHQANGIKFMWDACFESVKRIKKDKGSGCILAHCMGLGKTLQVISLTHTLLIHSSLTRVKRVLVVCPLSTVLNWVNEFKIWLKHAVSDYEIDIYELSRYKQNSERAFQLSSWLSGGGVCVLGYEMFRNLSADNNKKFRKKMLKSFQESLVDPGPDLVVCDEGHLLKNEKTSLSQSMNRVRTLRRIVLTGTPLQNNLKEYYCMVQFVKPNLLGKYNEYLNRFVNPITNGQYTDSTEYDIKVMKRRAHVLHKMLDGAVQRRDYGVLAPFLPPKHEYVLFITLTDVQVKLYQYYLDNYSRRPMPGKSSGFLFPDFQSLQRIWTHPLVLKYNSERYEIMQQKKREREEEEDSEGSLADFIDDDSSPEETSTEESSDDMSDASDDSRKKSKKKKAAKKGKGKDSKASTRRGTRANPTLLMEEEEIKNPSDDVEEVKNDNPTEWWIKLVSDEEVDDLRNSHKLLLLFDILRQCEAIGDKLLVFSQSLYSLDLIEHFLGKVDEATQEGRIDDKLAGHVGSWSPGVDYFRLDGSTSCENRSIWCKNFNREDNPRARLFLISTRAGGLGINLVAANRVIIFDVSWNPSHDVQSIFRVYRFGQKKPCYVYRFLAMGTMEEKIYERQVTKQAISKRVIDEQQIDRHYAENDLAELYTFQPRPDEPRAIPALPKDRLFAEMLKDHEAQIYKFHEHDSLLENKEEETLSEEERKAAWEDFENEKNKPPPAPFVSPWGMHNGMAPGMLAAQQQQLAYAALATMLRKDMPNINEQQIRDMLPIICNSNPSMFGGYDYGLMQKMNDIYKYAGQPGMMNPAMMNPMNASVGLGFHPYVVSIPSSRTKRFASTFIMRTTEEWNSLPADVFLEKYDLDLFKARVNRHFLAGSMGGASGLQYSPPWQRQQQQQQQMRLQQMLQQQNGQAAKYYAGGLGSRDPVAMALQQQRAREIMLGERGAAPRARGRPPLAPRPPPTHSADVVNLDSD